MATSTIQPEGVQDRLKSALGLAKDAFNVLRDLLLLLLLIALVFLPKHLNQVLTSAGIASIHSSFFEWQSQIQKSASQNASAAQDTTAAATSLQDVQSTLQKIVSTSKDQAVIQQATEASRKLGGSIENLEKANTTIASSLANQQDVLRSAATATSSAPPAATALQGWVYLGEADKSHQHWMNPPQPKVTASSPDLKPGDKIILTDDLFVRADKSSGQTFNQAPILGAVRAGTSATVLEVKPSSALNGGDFLWVKISSTASN